MTLPLTPPRRGVLNKKTKKNLCYEEFKILGCAVEGNSSSHHGGSHRTDNYVMYGAWPVLSLPTKKPPPQKRGLSSCGNINIEGGNVIAHIPISRRTSHVQWTSKHFEKKNQENEVFRVGDLFIIYAAQRIFLGFSELCC